MKWGRQNGVRRMLTTIEAEAAYTRLETGRKAFSDRVMRAMQEVPRDRFVPDHMKAAAFDNGPLPIGHGQTISQPYIVALMSDLLDSAPDHTVLEIGTGSGYQTAILSLLCREVYSVEVIPELSQLAARQLHSLGYQNVHLRSGDGYQGWPEHAPYDGIIVTAAAPFIPEALFEQLRPGGRLVIPVGQPFMHQELMVVAKDEQAQRHTSSVLGVAFVPMVDPGGRDED